MGSALVVGAGGAVGEAAALALAQLGWRVTASMHQQRDDVAHRLRGAGCEVVHCDIAHGDPFEGKGFDAAIFTTHLELTLHALERGSNAAHTIAFSSNNVAIHPEAPSYRALAEAEQKLQQLVPSLAVIRPTMIYGDPRLITMTRLFAWARKYPALPLPGSGRARLQPVFHQDLGHIAAGLAATPSPGVYAVGGPDIMSMRELYEAVIAAARARCRVIAIPTPLINAAAPVLEMFGYSRDQASRSERDRLAVAQTPLPADLAPSTSLQDGLMRLAANLGIRQRPDHGLAA